MKFPSTAITLTMLSCLAFSASTVSAQVNDDQKAEDTGTPAETLLLEEESRKFLILGDVSATMQDADVANAAAKGAIGLGYKSPTVHLYLEIAKGTRTEVGATLSDSGEVKPGHVSDYAFTLLDPAATNYSSTLTFGYFPDRLKEVAQGIGATRIGGFARLSMADVSWTIPSATDNELLRTSATTFAFDLCGKTFKLSTTAKSVVEIGFALCYSVRHLAGDIGHDDSKPFRAVAIGTTHTTFHGPSTEVTLRLGQIALGTKILALYDRPFFAEDSATVAGLTGLRFVPSVSAKVPIEFPLTE